MFIEEQNALKQEINAFSGYPWRSYPENKPMVTLSVTDNAGQTVVQFLTIEKTEQVISLLQNLIEEAKETRNHQFDDTPF